MGDESALVLRGAFARPGEVPRTDSDDITGLHAVAHLHPHWAVRLYGYLTHDGRWPIDPSRADAALHAAVRQLRETPVRVWGPSAFCPRRPVARAVATH